MQTVNNFHHNGLYVRISVDNKGRYQYSVETNYSERVHVGGWFPDHDTAFDDAIEYCNEWGMYWHELNERDYGHGG